MDFSYVRNLLTNGIIVVQLWYNIIKEINMPTIIPIKELKNTANISRLCDEKEEPVFVTKNGYGDLVVMSQKCYDNKHKDDFQSLLKKLYAIKDDYLNVSLHNSIIESAKSQEEVVFFSGIYDTVLKIKQNEVINNERY